MLTAPAHAHPAVLLLVLGRAVLLRVGHGIACKLTDAASLHARALRLAPAPTAPLPSWALLCLCAVRKAVGDACKPHAPPHVLTLHAAPSTLCALCPLPLPCCAVRSFLDAVEHEDLDGLRPLVPELLKQFLQLSQEVRGRPAGRGRAALPAAGRSPGRCWARARLAFAPGALSVLVCMPLQSGCKSPCGMGSCTVCPWRHEHRRRVPVHPHELTRHSMRAHAPRAHARHEPHELMHPHARPCAHAD